MPRIAVVTGANRCLGFETCRQLAQQGYQVILTSRDGAKGQTAAATLEQQGLPVSFHPLEVTDSDSVVALADFLKQKFNRLDVLVNSAGILPDPMNHCSVFEAQIDTLRQAMGTNVYGALRLCQALVPLMKANGYRRIVNGSSGVGQFSEMNRGYPAYRLSKTALNALTRILADELQGTNILANSVCPGWVKTGMGSSSAPGWWNRAQIQLVNPPHPPSVSLLK